MSEAKDAKGRVPERSNKQKVEHCQRSLEALKKIKGVAESDEFQNLFNALRDLYASITAPMPKPKHPADPPVVAPPAPETTQAPEVKK